MSEASTERPHLTMAEPGDLTDDEKARRAHITEQLEGIAARFEERNDDGAGDLAPVQLAASMWMARFGQLGPDLAILGEDYEGEVRLVGSIKYNAKTKKFEALVRCEEPVIRTAKREPAYAAIETGENQGQAQLRLFNA